MQKAIGILRSEHRSISAVLHGLQTLIRDARNPALKPDFAVFHAMLRYIDDFPERMHHPKEDKFLFARVAARAVDARPLIDSLLAEHVQAAWLLRDLKTALHGFETDLPGAAARFAAMVDDYAKFHWAHMKKEEDLILPLAERVLLEEDWRAIDAAFAGNEDPIADLREKDFTALFTHIVNLAPAPVGLGDRWEKRA